MRTYEITDAAGTVVRVDTVEDSIRPAMLDGHTAVLTHVDGERVEENGTDPAYAALTHAPSAAAVGVTMERPDAAHPGEQMPGQEVPPAQPMTDPVPVAEHHD